MVKTNDTQKHAVLSASGAVRWLSCTASARLEEKYPDATSTFAEEGTVAHELGELIAGGLLGLVPDISAGMDQLQNNPYYNDEMFQAASNYGLLVQERLETAQLQSPESFAELEVRLDFSQWVPEGFGTGDCVIVSEKEIEIIDLKYGKGLVVSAENNPQMRLYALGVLAKYSLVFDIEIVKTTIFQPRISPEPSSEVISVKELLSWADKEVLEKAKQAFSAQGVFAPSEKACKFCRAKGDCLARANQNMAVYEQYQEKQLDLDTAGIVLKQAGDMLAWLKDVEELVFSALKDHKPVAGWKLVEGRSVRKFSDTDKVKKTLLEAGFQDVVEEKLLALTALEKKFGKKEIASALGDLIIKPRGKPTLALESDKRKPLHLLEEILADFDED